jgi:predicted outer membrane repeat protein
VIAAWLASPAWAVTWPIPGPGGEGFEEVLALAKDGDIIEVGDDYARIGDLVVADLTVDLEIVGGPSRPLLPTLHVLGTTITARSVSLQGASPDAPLVVYDGLGAWLDGGSLTLVDATLLSAKDSAVVSVGGAVVLDGVDAAGFGARGEPVLNASGGTLDVVGGSFEANGAGVFVLVDVDATLTYVSFRANSAIQGADVAAYATAPHTLAVVDGSSELAFTLLGGGSSLFASGYDVDIQGTTFEDATAIGLGGAVYVDGGLHGGTLRVADAVFEGNYAVGSGGSIAAVEVHLEMSDVVVQDSKAYGAGALSSGGAVWQSGGTLLVERGTWSGLSVSIDGGALALTGVSAEIQDLVVEGCSALAGGAIHAVDSEVVWTNGTVVDCEAATAPVGWFEGGELTLVGGRFEGNGALVATLLASGASSVSVESSRWCNNDVGGETGVLHFDQVASARVERNVFLGDAGADHSASILLLGGEHEVNRNDFVGEAMPTTVGVDGAGLFFANNLVHGAGGLLDLGGATVAGGWNLWSAGGGAGLTDELLSVDPGLVSYVPGDCGSDLGLTADSPAIDAGNPDWSDLDGSRSDIGALPFGEARPGDLDGDGFVEDDCAPEDGEIFPGAVEVPYDGVDQDCDGSDLCDVDGDRHDAEACGGDDCDDADAAVFPGAPDPGTDDVDGDCSGTAATSRLSGGGGCVCDAASEGAGVVVVPWVAILAMARRRAARTPWPHRFPSGPIGSPPPTTRTPAASS